MEPPLAPRAPSYESGLSAALPAVAPAAGPESLGALARDGGLTLSSLDGEVVETLGNEDALSRPVSVPVVPVSAPPASPPAPTPATSQPAPAAQRKPVPSQQQPAVPGPPRPPRIEFRQSGPAPPVAPAPPPRPAAPQDPFAPPPEEVHQIELAYPEPRPSKQIPIAVGSGPHATTGGRPSGQVAAAPRVSAQLASAPPPAAAAEPVAEPAPEPARPRPPPLADPRTRLGVALLAGLLLGFLAAQLYASGAEDRLDEIRLELLREPIAQTTDEYQQALDRHDVARGRMERTKRRIELAAGFLWIAVGGGVAYAAWRFMPTKPS